MGQQKSRIISGASEVKKNIKKEEKEKIDKKKIVKKASKKAKIRSKRYKEAKAKIKIKSTKSVQKAIDLIKDVSKNSFNSIFEIHIALNLKPKEKINLKKVKPDAGGVIHAKIGKVSDKTEKIAKNFEDLVNEIIKSQPSGKKDFIKSIAICSTMSPSIKIIL